MDEEDLKTRSDKQSDKLGQVRMLNISADYKPSLIYVEEAELPNLHIFLFSLSKWYRDTTISVVTDKRKQRYPHIHLPTKYGPINQHMHAIDLKKQGVDEFNPE